MRRTPWPALVLTALASAAVVLLGLRVAEGRGLTVLPVSVLSTVVLLVITAVVVRLGWSVRQFRAGRRPGYDPILAARTVVLAAAAAWTGALLTGWYGGHVLLVAGDLAIEARRDVAVSAGAALVGAVLLAVAGLVVERWCEVRGGDDDDPGATTVPDAAA